MHIFSSGHVFRSVSMVDVLELTIYHFDGALYTLESVISRSV